MRLYIRQTQTEISLSGLFIIISYFFMTLEFSQITHIRLHHFKLFSRVKSTQDEKVSFIKVNELKLTFILEFLRL